MMSTQLHRMLEQGPLQYAIGQSRLDTVLVIYRQSTLCSISFGSTPTAVLDWAQGHYRTANLIPGGRDVQLALSKILKYIDSPTTTLSIPHEKIGTEFQHRVWEVIKSIPVGETMTYGEIAKRLNQPKATRAVARACGTNQVALVIPCHRVIGSDGKLTGYRWGVGRKKMLLDKEAEVRRQGV